MSTTSDSQGHQSSIKPCRIVIVGDGGTYKTSLLITYAQNKFPDAIPSTFENFEKVVKTSSNKTVLLSFKDTQGQDELTVSRQFAYTDATIILICFSVVNTTSFEHITAKWLPEIDQFCPNTPYILVGTGTELRSDEKTLKELRQKQATVITYDNGEELAKEINAQAYMECSVINNVGVREVIEKAIDLGLQPAEKRKKRKILKKILHSKKSNEDLYEIVELDEPHHRMRKILEALDKHPHVTKQLAHTEYILMVEFKGHKKRLHLTDMTEVEMIRTEVFNTFLITSSQRTKYRVEYFDEMFQDFVEFESLEALARIAKLRVISVNKT